MLMDVVMICLWMLGVLMSSIHVINIVGAQLVSSHILSNVSHQTTFL
jgi:hypothetical protein